MVASLARPTHEIGVIECSRQLTEGLEQASALVGLLDTDPGGVGIIPEIGAGGLFLEFRQCLLAGLDVKDNLAFPSYDPASS